MKAFLEKLFGRKITPLQMIALLSLSYGLAALIGGIFLLSLIATNPDATIETVLKELHAPFLRLHPGFLSRLLESVFSIHVWMLASFAFIYALMRFTETYGLWIEAAWGEIFAALSALIYLPFEIESMTHQLTWFNVASLLLNLLIIGYMLYKLREHKRK